MKRKFKFSEKDFTPGMLPQTRKQVFFDVLQLQWQKLLLLGLVLFLFYLPLFFSTVAKDLYVSNLYATLNGSDEAARLQAGQVLAILDILRSAVNILFLVALAVALSGILRILRQYAWGENVHFGTEFGKGIRGNFSQTAGILTLGGLIYCLCLSVYYLAPSYRSGALSLLSLLPIGISLLVVLPIFMIALVMIPIYQNTLRGTLKNAFFLYTRCLLKILAATLCTLLIWVPALIPNFYCHTIGAFVSVLLTPTALLGWTLFCYNCFDRHFNPIVAPELIGKGITMDNG